MKAVTCASCGSKMVKNGRTSSGRQRWRCLACGSSQTLRYDSTATRLEEFLGWLLSKETQLDMPGQGRSFRRRTAGFWRVWPMPEATGEAHRVIYVDGIYLARDLVVLIATADEHVLAWYMARSETSRVWGALLAPMPAPSVVVTDGGPGFAKAVREVWPETRVQRCVFHAFSQVRRYTTSRQRLQAGIELYGLAKDLMHLETLHQADLWVERYLQWCEFWADFLEERSWQDGRRTGYVPTSTAGKSNLTLGSTGVLTDPGSDSRTWVWAHLYDTGALEITASSTPDTLRTVLATGRICANAHYQAVSATPWYDQRASLRTCEFKADLGSVALASLDYWFYSNTTLTAVTGWANVRGLASLRYAFNACSGLVTLDLSGLDPSSLADLFYAFAQCGSLTTIYADASWALPAGVSGMGTFYNDTRLVGGNGTAYSSSAYGYARMVIDRAGQAGYLTAT